MKDLAGKVAVITGAGSGFGREFARIGAREGMRLVLADVQQDALDEAVTEARAAGVEAQGLRVDVSKNFRTAASSKDGEFDTSTTTDAPSRTSASPFPVRVFTPDLGDAATA